MDNVTRLLMQGAAGAAGSKTYVDDVFSTYLYTGNNSTQTITNGVDLEGEGGLVWIKDRHQNYTHHSLSTQGVGNLNQFLYTSGNGGFVTAGNNVIDQYNSNGFNLNIGSGLVNANNVDYTSWTFRKSPGFFDVVTWTGNGSNRTISHNLGSVPGCIMVKRTDGGSEDWVTYHRGISDQLGNNPGHYYLYLNTTNGYMGGASRFNNTAATSTEFTVGTDNGTNGNGFSYVAYVFAGGESTAATARSVDFDGSDDYLALGNSSDLSPEGGDFTFECWIKPDSWTTGNWDAIYVNTVVDGFYVGHTNANVFVVRAYYTANYIETSNLPPLGQWTHVAVTRSGSTLRLFYNGILEKSVTNSTSFATGNTKIANDEYGSTFDGDISNLRFVKGTAVYTSSFRPPTEPLTNITNTKLLCCNNSSTTGSTVAPATITSGGGPTASSDSPFDDPEGFQFGEGGDQNLIKCGSFLGNGSAGLEVNLGFEPQWILLKNASASENWFMFDNMRGIPTGYVDAMLLADTTGAEANTQRVDLTSTGFIMTDGNGDLNGSGNTIVYIAIRRPDGYVGKPAEAGTDAFAMDYGNSSGTIPNYDSTFPVDFAWSKKYSGSGGWYTGARLTGSRYMQTDASNAEADAGSTNWTWDSNVGWQSDSGYDSTNISHMWKRHVGFDVVTWKSGGSGETHFHGLGKAPEMIWIKNRSSTALWRGGHKGLNGGTNPWTYGFTLNNDSAEFQEVGTFWNGVVPSATSFSTGSAADAGGTSGDNYIAMLFASVDGISKVGSYTGTSSNPSVTITTGFSPRFLLIKRVDGVRDWCVFDTLRGIGSGSNDYKLRLNSDVAQSNGQFVDVTSTGFTAQNVLDVGTDGGKYIYYAHA